MNILHIVMNCYTNKAQSNKSNIYFKNINGGLNNGPFDDRTDPDDLNTGLVRYWDPHCIRFSYNYWNKRKKMPP